MLRLRVRVSRRGLDALLAEGGDPWSSTVLLTRAAQISSAAHRERVASSLDTLVQIAEYRRRASPYLTVRTSAVLRERETIVALALALARRLRDPAPVAVGVVARLAVLVWDEMSPVFAGGRPVRKMHRAAY